MRYFLRHFLLSLLIAISSMHAYSVEDSAVDSLLNQLSLTNDEIIKVDILLDLASKTSWTDVAKYEDYAQQALELSQKNNYIKGLAYSNYWLAKVFSEYELDLSEKLIINSLNYAEQLEDSLLIGMAYQVFGNLKYNVELYADAEQYYLKALGIYLRKGKPRQAAGIYNNLGILKSIPSADSSSFQFYQRAVDINLQEGNFLKLAINYLNFGVDYIDLGYLNLSKTYIDKSFEVAKEHNFLRLYPWIYNNLSNYYLINEEFAKANEYARESLLLSRQYVNSIQELGALKQLEDISVKMLDKENSYKYSKLINALSDSINKRNRLRELDILETRFRFEEQIKKQEFENLKIETEYYRRELIYVLVILVTLIFVFTFIGLYLFQRNKIRRKTLEQENTLLQKEQLSKDLEFKNKELTTNVMYLLKKNEFISNISDKLKNMDLEEGIHDRDIIRKIVLELDKSISDNNWEEFEIRFKEVHVGFYNNLSKRYPDLTPNELRLCAFLRLNMTSKEISELTFQSPESIKKARYRLRKKLDLVRDDALVTFLSKL